MNTIKRGFLVLLSCTFLTFTACDEDPAKSVEENVAAAGDYLLSELAFFDIYQVIDKAARDSALWNNGTANIDAAVVTLLPGDAGMQISYGDSNKVCPDGKLRRGSIVVNMSGAYFADSSEATVTFDNYYYEDYKIEGTQKTKILGKNLNDEPEVLVEVIEGKVLTDEGTILLNTSKILAWLQGYETFEDISDDAYAFRSGGTISGISRKGTEFNLEVIEDLVYRRSCEWIESGSLTMSLTGLLIEEGTVEFGDGTCDSRVLLVFDGIEVPFYLD